MIVATLSLTLRDEAVADGMRVLDRILAEVRSFAGCEGVEILVDVDDPTRILIIERWASLEDDLAYLQWRAGEGKVDLAPLLNGPTSLTRYTTRTDV